MEPKKNFFYRINPNEVLAELVFVDNREQWLLQFFNDLRRDDPEKAQSDIAKKIIQEAHSFRQKRSIAGRASAEQRANKAEQPSTSVEHMLDDVEQETVSVEQSSTRSSSSNNNNIPPKGDGLFDKFWEAYPKKKGKGAAESAWKKVKLPSATLQEILKALEWQRVSNDWVKENGQYIPNPATYLNQKRWLDEPIKQVMQTIRNQLAAY